MKLRQITLFLLLYFTITVSAYEEPEISGPIPHTGNIPGLQEWRVGESVNFWNEMHVFKCSPLFVNNISVGWIWHYFLVGTNFYAIQCSEQTTDIQMEPGEKYGAVVMHIVQLINNMGKPSFIEVPIPGWSSLEQFTVFDRFIAYWSVEGDWSIEGSQTFAAVFDFENRNVIRKEPVGPAPPGTDFGFFYNPVLDGSSRTVIFEAVNENYKRVVFDLNL